MQSKFRELIDLCPDQATKDKVNEWLDKNIVVASTTSKIRIGSTKKVITDNLSLRLMELINALYKDRYVLEEVVNLDKGTDIHKSTLFVFKWETPKL